MNLLWIAGETEKRAGKQIHNLFRATLKGSSSGRQYDQESSWGKQRTTLYAIATFLYTEHYQQRFPPLAGSFLRTIQLWFSLDDAHGYKFRFDASDSQ